MTGTHAIARRLALLTLHARALDFRAAPITLGNITLLPHQTAATHWLQRRIDTFGGALLADPPGLGKTYVALAVAAERQVTPLVIAPAGLRTRWSDAARETGVTVDFVSTERLSSPTPLRMAQPAFVIIDEAHHLRTTSTRRYHRTASLCADALVLLLSATPIHNATHDLQHIITLFHLPPTRASATVLRRRLTLRRTIEEIRAAGPNQQFHALPEVRHRRAMPLRVMHSLLPRDIAALPRLIDDPPDTHRLIQLGLLHALRSSEAAAIARIRRRIAVTLAIEHAARDHVEPTAALKRAFRTDEGAVQLAMAALLSTPGLRVAPGVAAAARRQRRALEAMLTQLDGAGDQVRARVLRRIARWSRAPVVAFTQFNATAAAFYHHLRDRPGIAWLGGTTAHITSGVIARDEALQRFLLPRFRDRHDGIRLLITTDVVSEGLSLAGVATVVHLDLPWTAARVDQRVGRAARIGAGVPVVSIVELPAPLHDVHRAVQVLVARKRRHMGVVDGTGDDQLRMTRVLRRLCDAEPCRGRRRGWVTMTTTTIRTPMVIAEVRVAKGHWIVAADARGIRRPRASDWDAVAAATVVPRERQTGAGERRAFCDAACAHLADREMMAVVTDAYDPRLQQRREADDRIVRGERVSRAVQAADVTGLRRTIMHTGGVAGDAKRGARDAVGGNDAQRALSVLASTLSADVRVIAAVRLLPGL
ncbi:MAG: DEAD/DEAH box helicase [Gemmatimonadaceae bacterium]|nr:DEAD/DEAH box helicase [Gemmatimonadaceae bacterium]